PAVSLLSLHDALPIFVVTESLLGGLLGSSLDLLLGGTTLQVSVQSVHASGWTSAPSNAVPVRGALLAGTGLAAGSGGCAPAARTPPRDAPPRAARPGAGRR